MGQVIAFPVRNKRIAKDGNLATYEFDLRSERDAFVRIHPGSWAGYSVTPDGYRWFAYTME